jgi:DNA-binding MarR family transcriptional regulator
MFYDRSVKVRAVSAKTKSALSEPAAASASLDDPVHEIRRLFAEQNLPGSPERAALAGALERASRSVHADIETTLRQFDLSRSRYQLLHELRVRPEGIQLARLGALLFVHPATVTSLVDRLDASGLLERLDVEGDRRATVARITKRGDKAAQAAFRALADEDFALGHLTLAEVNTLRTLLVKVLGDRPAR